jgi:hypothetical protein
VHLLLITYNLNKGDADYDRLFEFIRELGDTWHDATKLDSVWFVRTRSSPTQARDHIAQAMSRDDNCFIVEITGAARNGWMPKEFWPWLD